MKIRLLLTILTLVVVSLNSAASGSTSKKERNYIVAGNEAYKEANYNKAIENYRKALTLNPSSETAQFNLASALMCTAKSADINTEPLKEASTIFTSLAKSSNKRIAQKSIFNLGHIAYNSKNYSASIELYKSVLRQDPDNDKARKYLRMAQLKLQQQQQDNKQQDKDDKSKEDKKEQEQEKKEEQKEQNQNQNQSQNQQQPEQQQNINDANAAKILKSIENKEQETLMRLNQRSKNARQMQHDARGKVTDKPW